MPKKTEKTFNTIRTAISRLLETDSQENRGKAKKCIEIATQDGTIIPHLQTLHEYLQKHAKDSHGKHKPVVNELRSWLNQATPVIELSTANKGLLIQELRKEEPNVELIKQTLHKVTSLNLLDNQIGDPGAQAIAEALKSNTTLTSLNLLNNQIGGPGAQAIAEVLKSNYSLTSLDLSYDGQSHELLGQAKAYLERNKERLAKATHYLQTTFVSDVVEVTPVISELAKIISDYVTPSDLTSKINIDPLYNQVNSELTFGEQEKVSFAIASSRSSASGSHSQNSSSSSSSSNTTDDVSNALTRSLRTGHAEGISRFGLHAVSRHPYSEKEVAEKGDSSRDSCLIM